MKEEHITIAISLPKSLFDKVNEHKSKSQFIQKVLEAHFEWEKDCAKDFVKDFVKDYENEKFWEQQNR